MSLEELRDALSDIDRQIIDLIAERQRIVAEIGLSKLSEGTATRDFAREKVVIDRGRAQAEKIGVDPRKFFEYYTSDENWDAFAGSYRELLAERFRADRTPFALLATVALGLLLFDPLALFQPGFQLS